MTKFVKKVYLPAFQWFKDQFGHLKVPQKFVIPSDTTVKNVKIPDGYFRGNKLGRYVDTIRKNMRGVKNHHYCEKDLAELKEMGFIENIFDEKNRCILLAFSEYKDRFGDCSVVASFKIPKNDLSWSKEVRGMNS